jgi:A-macroglobulin TED domain/Alpha-2-macroglobulin family/Carboxypeptidase regulatory-like domain/MG2 domain/A-macroglobulin receptor binding domain/Alpha-2-macroglobulin bait region domain
MHACRYLFLRLLLPLALLLFVAAVVLSLTHARAQQPAATYTHGNLSVTIPYHSAREGSGRLVAEILDPEDHVLGRVEHTVEIAKGDGLWQQVIAPEKPIPFEDIIWQRMRYRFEYKDDKFPAIEGIESISQILRRPVVHILGQTQYLTGSQAAIRVIVSDATNNEIAPSTIRTGTLRIELLIPKQKSRPLFSGRLNHRGTVEAQFRFPAGVAGKYDLHYVADTPIGSSEYTQPIQLEDKASILLTTEKPIYQPGQTIHVRALALNRADYKAEADSKLTFELEDSRGNKVFKKSTETDKFGIASAEFSLADEVNLGTYHLRVLMGDASSPSNTAEIALNVERYVLPKFKVAVEFAEKDNKPKRDYRPGEHVTGTVRANYFFGKPVDHADITIKASSMDVAVFEAASAVGQTDNDGVYHFDLQLPSYFAGRPLSQGSARALIEATVKDSAAHAETRGEPITISQSSLLITAVPEGGTLIPHLENQVFVLSSYPDGTPASTSLTVHLPGVGQHDQQVSTDSGGVAVIPINPGSGIESLHIEADDHHGNRTSSNVPLQTRAGVDQILLRTNRAVLKAGDPIEFKILSTRASGPAYIDVVKNGQTILTRDLDLQNGQASLTLTATPEMAGTLDVDAYLFGRDAQPVADHRLVFIHPADELKIETTTDSAVYKPGSDARIHFHVTNCHGEGVSAALGLQVVDEAVFALAEKQPGFAKVFFYLEQEVMKPRYEIHSLSMSNVVEPADASQNGQQDLAARALFSATEMATPTKLDTEFGRSLPQDKYTEYQQRYYATFNTQVGDLTARLSRTIEQHPSTDMAKAFESLKSRDGSAPRDAWTTPLRIEPAGWNQRNRRYFRIRSAGPDRRFDTADDLAVFIQVDFTATGNANDQPGPSDPLDFRIEHDRGPFNNFAEFAGTVTDSTGAVIPDATITLRNLTSKSTRTTHTNAEGRFILSGLPPARYKASITSPGFRSGAGELTLAPRDSAVVTTVLKVGNVTETVAVTNAGAMSMPIARMAKGVVNVNGAMGGPVPPAPMAAPGVFAQDFVDVVDAKAASLQLETRSFNAVLKSSAPAAPHVRSYFPEALYINPEIITDAKGNASISIPIADSITTWRMAMLASTQSGALGTGTSSLKVFQDFFVDLDLPVTLTQGDRVSIPIAVYNYSGKPGEVSLKLQPEDWFSLEDDTSEKTLSIESGRVGGSQFTLDAKRIGKFKLTLSAHMDGGAGREDIVVREIEVIPNGREQNLVFNGRLENSAQHDLHFPAASIPDATSIFVRLYPGPLSQVIEGMDSILSMPGGCFEQTSSSTYPNVLALDYMKRTKKLTPEVHAKAEGYIANGYQRLLTFEVLGGGFSWFGQAPANKILTAYGLMEFSDMSKVSDVDPRLIERTRDWLAQQQQPDGSWKPDSSFINEGATNRYNSDILRITAYIAWSLVNTGYQGPAVEKAKHFIESHSGSKPDTYTLAIIANFAADYGAKNGNARDFTRQSMQALLDARTEKDDQVSWSVEETGVYSTGSSAAIETTGLAAQALLKWGQASETVRKALNFISSKKQASGNWGTTQATIMALRALLLASQLSASDVRGSLQVILNGKPVETLKLTPDNNDLLHQFAFKGIDAQKPATVELKFEGTGGLAYQVVGRYFTPWDEKPVVEPLSIDVAYDRTKLAQNDIATATVTVRNNLTKTANMVMVDLGIPPGFDLLSEDLQSFQEKSAGDKSGRLEKFSLTATQAILYFNALSPKQTVTLNVRLRAKYPIRAHTFQSRVYEYYDPEVKSTARPVQLEVREH